MKKISSWVILAIMVLGMCGILLAQGTEPYTIRQRQSAQGRYVAFHLELYVDTPRTALARKTMLAAVDGVLWML